MEARKRYELADDFDDFYGDILGASCVNSGQFNGSGRRVFRQFVADFVKRSGGDLYLTVRKKNTVACQFYERHGMTIAGTVSWSCGSIPGLVYRLSIKSVEASISI